MVENPCKCKKYVSNSTYAFLSTMFPKITNHLQK